MLEDEAYEYFDSLAEQDVNTGSFRADILCAYHISPQIYPPQERNILLSTGNRKVAGFLYI